MRWDYRTALIVVIAAGLGMLTACGNGGAQNIDDPTPGAVEPIDQIKNGDTRLPDAAGPTVSEIFGVIELKNLTLADEPVNGPGGSGGQASQIPEEKILVRVIDPGEDILIATVHPDLTGHFKFSLVKEYPTVHVEVDFSVIEDMNGNEQADDHVMQTIPIAPKVGKAASMEIAFSRTLPRDIPDIPDMGDKPPVQPILRPEAGFMLVTELVIEDAYGHHEDVYGVNYETNTVVYDTDDDNALEFGDDYVDADEDMNGLADSFETFELPADLPDPEQILLRGVIINVSSAASTITVRLEDATEVTVFVNPLAAIEHVEYDEELLSNDFFGPLTLDSGLVGKHCQIIALPVTEGFRAEWVLVSDDPAPLL